MQQEPEKLKEPFERVASQAYPVFRRAATVLCWSWTDVEDVVQETMLAAFKAYDSFRGDSSFVTWAYRILARNAQSANQKLSRTIPVEYGESQPEHLPPVDRTVVLEEEAGGVVDAIRSLPRRQREMITLYLLKDCSYAEICVAMDVSLGTVKATLFEAKMSLRNTLVKRGITGKKSYELP